MFRIRRKWAQAKQRAEEARREAQESHERLAKTREEVVTPLRQAAEHNRFATLIRDSLLDGDR